MDNYLEKITQIKEVLKANGQDFVADKLTELQISGGTPGERFLAVVYYLKHELKENAPIYSLIQKQADELINYAYELNYLQR